MKERTRYVALWGQEVFRLSLPPYLEVLSLNVSRYARLASLSPQTTFPQGLQFPQQQRGREG